MIAMLATLAIPYTTTLDKDSGHADQGSEVNIVAPSLVDRLGIPRRSLGTIGLKQVVLINSSGKSDAITEFIVVNVQVQTIWRTLWAFVQPPGGKDVTLLPSKGLLIHTGSAVTRLSARVTSELSRRASLQKKHTIVRCRQGVKQYKKQCQTRFDWNTIGREAHEKYISRRREPWMSLVLGLHAIQSGPETPSSSEIAFRSFPVPFGCLY
ncbi:uncharacterized protein PG998_004538 [Apiospora kogelbergensis]|uniref:uncharacterized protein n=1 Tax=Apiospora kogelbergensis TaxID=1337665 RepID=UPI00312E535E